MLKLTLTLCAAMFAAMLIGGRDHGQLRPGLAAAQLEAAQAPVTAQAAVEPAEVVTQAAFTPATALPAEVVAPANELALPLVQPEAVETALAEAEAPVEEAPADVWYVAADTVNVREGPGTTYGILDKLANGDAVSVVWQDDTGWAKIRIEGDGIEGYVSTDFLTQSAP
ncbi:SH3 domain-containing protein [Neogemmobacter tilapiae]|uniref:Peptide-binding protein n=1 Tax=Neogemmobacter tilapiae TaxID=875041 RepID=A0A918TJT0_9RHOB|nr:SH3 domain-containing protein [Gemmobacter tilapiae]GHC52264.1 peptide-binding protein [Gemmobacter tilapiae]